MSFSMQVKDEVARLPLRLDCCQRAELAAFAQVVGIVRLGKQRVLVMTTELPAVARRIFLLSKNLGWNGVIVVHRYSRPRHRRLFTVQVPLEQQKHFLLQELGFVDSDLMLRDSLDSRILKKDCCKKAFLRGCFLGCGFLGKPSRAYHLELFLKTHEAAIEVTETLACFGLLPICRERRGGHEVYLKEADQVSEFLRIIEANQGVLQFENCRVLKDMRNQVNRLVNCETANLEKAVEAGLKQVAVIKEIDSLAGLGILRPPLREVAELRLQYPGASLAELGKLLSPPLSKSGVNHRFREIYRIADQLRKEQ
jgi:DNA-binding protein WhiA